MKPPLLLVFKELNEPRINELAKTSGPSCWSEVRQTVCYGPRKLNIIYMCVYIYI